MMETRALPALPDHPEWGWGYRFRLQPHRQLIHYPWVSVTGPLAVSQTAFCEDNAHLGQCSAE
jgi:hypothetical protein